MKKRILQFFIFDILCIALLCTWIKQPVLFANPTDFPAQADITKLEKHTRMLSETFAPRDYTYPENLNRTADYIQSEFEKTSGRLEEQPYIVDGVTYKNVILELGPRLAESDGLIVLGAHYDAFDVHPAADDNASGVAGLIELSRLLDGAELNKTVQFVAYTLEEPPFFRSKDMGSARHATSLAASSIPIDLMISLEMIGYFSDEPDSQRYPVGAMGWLYPTTGNFVGVIGRFNQGLLVRQVKREMLIGSDLPVEAIAAPPNLVPGIDFSDHLNYWQYDYPAVMVTDTAFNRNFAYHTAEDTADRLDYDRMGKVVQGIYGVVLDQQ